MLKLKEKSQLPGMTILIGLNAYVKVLLPLIYTTEALTILALSQK